MKKLHHLQRPRKFGQLTNLSDEAKTGPKTRSTDAWAVSLHVVEPQPLTICYTSHREDNSVRRSPRLASNGCKTPRPVCSRSRKQSALDLCELKKSPATFFSSSAPALTSARKRRRLLALPEPGSSKGCLSERCLRSRTVLMRVGDGGDSDISERRLRSRVVRYAVAPPPEKRAVRNGDCSLFELTDIDANEGEISRNEMLPWREKSPTVEMQLQEEKVPSGIRLKEKKKKKKKKKKKESLVITPKKESFLGQLSDGLMKREEEKKLKPEKNGKNTFCSFIGEPIPEEEAQQRWQWRYDLKSRKKGKNWKINADKEDEIILNVESHYAQAKVGNFVLNIGDSVLVKGEGNKKHIGVILEFFKTTDGEDYFRVQWFFRAEDTVLKDAASSHDKRRVFYSNLMNDNLLDCIISKVNIVRVPPMACSKQYSIQSAAFYYDMEYCMDYSTFRTFVTETSINSKNPVDEPIALTPSNLFLIHDSPKKELALLDLYAGCGGMSTGLCLGAKLASVNLVTKWAVDYNSSACESLKLNHPETNVRNESAEDFLDLLKQWKKLCKTYACDIERTLIRALEEPLEGHESDAEESSGEYEVSRLVEICYGDPNERGKRALHFKVRWKGYGPDDDTWEPAEGLRNCRERIKDFVRRGFNARILPLPGDVDVICGGPPCQGISGYNRHRNFDSPLDDERNRQIVVFMDIVEFLKPRYCLMENVVDIIRFDKGSLGRYALSRLVRMKYQARLGTIASGCYGLPQFRLRVFIWGADPIVALPQFPLPTHDVVAKYWPPIEFERNIVAYDEGRAPSLEDAVVLRDSISDLPEVANDESREEMEYEKLPETEFQKLIRTSKDETISSRPRVLYDHRPLKLSEHDYMRVTRIPHKKGANFRDLPGVVIGDDNVARRDPSTKATMLPTGRPLIPDCVFAYENGKSRRPYGRLWWDETVSTVVTFPNIRAQVLLHPEQDRVLTLRELARLQGFPDYYRFCGTTKERYCQIGNAVSIPVSRALGYALGMACRNVAGEGPLMTLPPGFSTMLPPADEKL